MSRSAINIEVMIIDAPVDLEIEVEWSFSVGNEFTIDDFTVYCMDNLTEPDWPTYERAPYWLHKIIEKSELLYDHDEDIVNNCADGDY